MTEKTAVSREVNKIVLLDVPLVNLRSQGESLLLNIMQPTIISFLSLRVVTSFTVKRIGRGVVSVLVPRLSCVCTWMSKRDIFGIWFGALTYVVHQCRVNSP